MQVVSEKERQISSIFAELLGCNIIFNQYLPSLIAAVQGIVITETDTERIEQITDDILQRIDSGEPVKFMHREHLRGNYTFLVSSMIHGFEILAEAKKSPYIDSQSIEGSRNPDNEILLNFIKK